ncbi:Uncharacterised protein [Dermatophilus congolensis]|uniref:Uncharacterized protein n=1 Tax=Dermatophilus congolensis TaxID=1863 RepID=A0A239VPG8_9MICO|nr:Uncharacterised protein [Dermatophilus congolensis]
MPLPLAELCNDSLPRGGLTPGDADLNEREQSLVFHAHGVGMFLGRGIRQFWRSAVWYSLLHMPPEDRGLAFRGFARVRKPKGNLLFRAFLGSQNISFDHTIT